MSLMILWSVFGYFVGAIPFAHILANLFAQQDIPGRGSPISSWGVPREPPAIPVPLAVII